MTAKEYLKQYEKLNIRAQRYRQEYKTELEKIDAIGSTLAGDGLPHGSGVSRKTEDKAIRLAEKAAKWKTAELDAIEKRQQVFDVVIQIPGIEGDVLYNKYIKLMKWEEIALELHYSVRGIWYAHGRALRMVEEIITSVH